MTPASVMIRLAYTFTSPLDLCTVTPVSIDDDDDDDGGDDTNGGDGDDGGANKSHVHLLMDMR